MCIKSKLDNIDPEKIREYAARGLTQGQIAKALNISRTTYYKLKRQWPQEFLDALEQGQAQGELAVANVLYEAAINGNVTAAIFYLKSRCGWSEKSQVEVSHNEPVKIIIKNDL